jgi:diguanylate cyclase (GGDEF)-like protein/PAS domain S-box-containing protein
MFTHWQPTPYALPSLLSALVCIGLLPQVWRRRPAPGTAAFLALLVCLALWSSSHALSVLVADLPSKRLLLKLQVLGSATAPLAWFAFALSYTGLAALVTRAVFALLGVIPLLTIALAFTNERHGLLWRQLALVQDAPFAALYIDRGPWFSVQTAYAYLLVLLSTALTVWTLSQAPHQRRQLMSVAIAPLLVGVVNLRYLTGWSLLPPLDLTPPSFAAGALLLVWILSRYRLFDVIPVSRSAVIEGMNESVVVLDQRGRVLDLNAAAQRALALSSAEAVGHPLPRALEAARPAGSAPGRPAAPWEVVLDGGRRTYQVSSSPLSRGSTPLGEVLVLHDTTARKQTEAALLRAKEELQGANQQLALLANTDALTGLNNRRLFLHRLAEEAARARRHHQPLSVLMLDLDYFKRINDTFGHGVGDQVLVAAAGAIGAVKRETDISGRIGGEEFGLILPATDLEGARVMAERLRSSIGTQRHLTDDGSEFAVTASLGVASFASGVRDERELLSLADAALYYAKELGRDRVCVAGGPAATV